MGGPLSDKDKVIILAVATLLVGITLVLTMCLVLPFCLLYRKFVKPKTVKKEPTFNIVYPTFVNPESQHFRLSIVPVYGSKNDNNEQHLTDSELKHSNQYENLTQLAKKTRIRYASLKPDNLKELPLFPKVKCLMRYEVLNETAFRLHLNISQVCELKIKENMVEPSCYVMVMLVGYKPQRKSIIHKATQSEIFRTDTVKRSISPVFSRSQFVSEKLPKCLLKEGCIKLRLMDEERHANDVCLGEVAIPLKKIPPLLHAGDQEQEKKKKKKDLTGEGKSENDTKTDDDDVEKVKNQEEEEEEAEGENDERNKNEMSAYTLFPAKEVKGDLHVGFCYLPTSKRINITVLKATLRHSPQTSSGSLMHQAFYTRILMFSNGKLIKKKKTSMSIRMTWGENDIISFDLNNEPFENISFMLVLSSKMQNSNTPSSPESPQSPESVTIAEPAVASKNVDKRRSSSRTNSTNSNQSRKDRHIGHFVLDKETWLEEIVKRPRKQVLKWYKLY